MLRFNILQLIQGDGLLEFERLVVLLDIESIKNAVAKMKVIILRARRSERLPNG